MRLCEKSKQMIRILTLIVISLTVVIDPTFGQIYEDKKPVSFSSGMDIFDESLEANVLPALNMEMVQKEDKDRDSTGLPPYDGRRILVDWSMENNGTWFELDDGSRLWKMKVQAPGALSLEVFFDDFYLPEGAEFYLYSIDGLQYEGAHTSANNPESGYYSTGMIHSETVILEYFEPSEVTDIARIDIQDVGYRYRDLTPQGSRGSDDCQVDINCPEGDDWQDQKKGAVRLRVSVSGGGTFWCSGSLMNNTAGDCKPYVLSAFHCIDQLLDNMSDFEQLRFYFNFERPDCFDGNAPAGQQVMGCSIAARSNSASGSGSDFVLLELLDEIPEFYEPYWNGWNLQSTTISGGGVGIHHPSGDSKKISTSTSNFVTTTWNFGGAQAYWRVFWSETESGHGVTEGGSSGSPLFDSNGLVVGTLTGGASFCNSVQPGGKDDPDWYGKISYHWDQNTGSQVIDLKTKLDPLNTGQSALMGTYAPCDGSSTSVDDLSDDELIQLLSVYPNPSEGVINIDLSDYESTLNQVNVFNIVGKQVASIPVNADLVRHDLSDLPAGIYLLTFEFADRPAISQKIALSK